MLVISGSTTTFGYADAYPWKLLTGGIEASAILRIEGQYTTKAACQAEELFVETAVLSECTRPQDPALHP